MPYRVVIVLFDFNLSLEEQQILQANYFNYDGIGFFFFSFHSNYLGKKFLLL